VAPSGDDFKLGSRAEKSRPAIARGVAVLIGSALGDTWGFTAFLAKLPWWPDVVGAAIAASIFPWLPALL